MLMMAAACHAQKGKWVYLFDGHSVAALRGYMMDTFPSQAVSLIQSSSAKRIFTYDQWSDYLIYRLYPSIQVFNDGRSEGWPVGRMIEFIEGGGPEPLRLSERAQAYLKGHQRCGTADK